MKAKFNKLDRSKLSKEVNSILDKIKKATDNFKKEDKKAEALFDRLYDKIKEGKPEAIKTTKKPSKSKKKKTSGGNRGVFTKLAKSIRDAKPSLTWKQAMAEASKKLKADKEKANKKFSSSIQTLIDANKSYFGSAKASSLEKDAKQPAKPIGKRRSKKGKTYYEYRTNRTDVKQPPKSFPMLEKGGNVDYKGTLSDDVIEDIVKDKGFNVQIRQNLLDGYQIIGQKKELDNVKSFLEKEYNVKSEFLPKKGVGLHTLKVPTQTLMFGKGGNIDLFENYETLPKKVRDTIDFYMEKYQDGDYDYEDSKNFLEEMQKQGYTFEYGLDNEPYDLRKMAKGGKIGFEGLAKKVAKNYEGKKVKPKFQSEYGKTYDKEEAMQVGRAVAGKVLKQQNMKKMEDGGIVRNEGVAYQGGMSYGTTENIAPQFKHGGNVDKLSQSMYGMSLDEIDGEGIDDIRKLKAIINELNEETKIGRNRGSFNVTITMKDGRGADILPIDVSEKDAKEIADMLNNMKPMSARAEVPLFAKGGMTTKMYYIVYNEANGEKSYAEVPATSEKEAIEKLKKEGGVERIVRVRKMDKDEYAKGGTIIKKGNRVRVVNTQFDGKEGLVVSNDLHNNNYQVQMQDGKIKGFPFENLMLLSREKYAKGGAIKGRNNKTGESFGVVIGSMKYTDEDKDRVQVDVRSRYSSRISERQLVFDTKGNLIRTTDYGYTLDGTLPKRGSGQGKSINASNKKETIDALEDLGYNKGFANKLIDAVKDEEFSKGGKTQGYNSRLDESLGNRKGKESTKQQSKKDRRDESKGMEKGSGRRAYSSVSTMDVGDRMMAKGGRLTSYGLSFEKVDYDVNVNPKNLEVDVNIKESDSVNHNDLNDSEADWEQHHWGYMVYPKNETQLYDVLKALRVSVSKQRLSNFVKEGSYAKGGKVKAKKEIAEGLEELEVGLAGASKKHKQQSKLAKQIKDGFESSFKKGGNVPKRFLDEKGERKNDPETIEELTKYVMSLPQTKSKHFNKVTKKYSPKRQKLHRQIINKFKGDLVCIESDEPIAILMGGSPASGKSTFLRKYAPYLLKEELLRIDADEVRAMLPEYKGWNASATHNETQDIVKTLLSDRTIGVPCKYDLIFDGTMTSPKKYLDLIRLLKKLGYKVFVVFIDKVPKDVIMKRAMDRYKKSGRFVPPFVIEEFFESGKDSLAKVKAKVDGYMIVDGSDSNYKVSEQKGLKLPKTRKYSRLGVPLKKRVTRKKR